MPLPQFAYDMLMQDAAKHGNKVATYCGTPDTEMNEDQLRLFLRSAMADLSKERNSPNPFR